MKIILIEKSIELDTRVIQSACALEH